MSKTVNILEPVPVTNWQTSDGKTHKQQDVARRHETFLAVRHALPNNSSNWSDSGAAYAIIMALATRFDFVERAK